ncbi:Geranylgeranyl reductase [Burkholderiales bacterium]|nr:Geranylgeranyl reductase [Burkholderiales bacterium]
MTIETNGSFDVLIAGAGPAGAYLGYLLARQGIGVAIIDKSPMPRDKVCGGGLSRKAVELLDFDITPAVHRWIRGARLSFQDRSSIVKDIDPPAGCTVLRRQFDYLLLERACAAGAKFYAQTPFVGLRTAGETVEVQTGRGAFCCRLLIGADGVGSTVRRKVFGRRIVRYVPALETLVPLVAGAATPFDQRVLFDFGAVPHGYGWIFPKRDHLNIGVYSPWGGEHLREHLASFIARQEGLRLPADAKYLGSAIPVKNAPGLFQGDRVWLLGDAAGFADGLFGEGIYFALKSAALAAQALQETRVAPNNMRYTQLVRQRLLPDLRASQWMGKALFAFPRLAFTHLVSNPRMNDCFAGLISGAVGYRECLVKTLVGTPRWLFSSASMAPQPALAGRPRGR